MRLLEFLEKYQKKRKQFSKGEECKFFLKNRNLLVKVKGAFPFLIDNKEKGNDFNIMRANIIIHGLINKSIIEQEVGNLVKYTETHEILTHQDFVETLKERILTRPYLEEKEGRIYIPFFPKSINSLYLNEPEKLNEYPYTDLLKSFSGLVIDPFDTYGNELYNTHFTRLVKVGASNNVIAFFHYDTYTIYMINDQGRLDSKIVLFDKYLSKLVTTHMLERVKPVVDAYFANNLQEFLKSLENNGFLSSKMLYKITHKYRDLG